MSSLTRRSKSPSNALAGVQAKFKAACQVVSAKAMPFTSLPVELIVEIFWYTLPTCRNGIDWFAQYGPRRPHSPLLLMQVCRAWRQITLQTPKLWQELALCVDPEAPAVERFDFWVKHAGPLPIDVTLCNMDEDDAPLMSQFFECFRRHAPRIRSLSLDLSLLYLAMFSDAVFEFPNLEQLRIDRQYYGLHMHTGVPLRAFERAPQLHALTLMYCPVTNIGIAWKQLRSLSLFQGSLGAGLEALRLATELTRFDLTMHRQSIRHDSTVLRAVTHANIQHLRLYQEDGVDDPEHPHILHALGYLTLPSLNILDLGEGDRACARCTKAFLDRSQASLNTLILKSPSALDAWPEREGPLFGATVTSLTIDAASGLFTSFFFGPFANELDFLPNLESLTLRYRMHELIHNLELKLSIPAFGVQYRKVERQKSGRPCSMSKLTFFCDAAAQSMFQLPPPSVAATLSDLKCRFGLLVYVGTPLDPFWDL